MAGFSVYVFTGLDGNSDFTVPAAVFDFFAGSLTVFYCGAAAKGFIGAGIVAEAEVVFFRVDGSLEADLPLTTLEVIGCDALTAF